MTHCTFFLGGGEGGSVRVELRGQNYKGSDLKGRRTDPLCAVRVTAGSSYCILKLYDCIFKQVRLSNVSLWPPNLVIFQQISVNVSNKTQL